MRTPRFRRVSLLPLETTVACLGLVLFACGDGGPDGPIAPQPPRLTAVSGHGQPGGAGQQLGQPFVVRATDRLDRGLQGLEVTWTVTNGEGILGESVAGLEDDQTCSSASTTSVRTDANGLARVSLMPTWFGRVTVTASLPGAPDPVRFATDASDPGAVLRIVAGNDHVGQAGELDEENPGLWKARRFEVQATDGRGVPVPHLTVRWAITSGDMLLVGCGAAGQQWPPSTWSRTRSDGIAYADYRLVAAGRATVAAAVPGVAVSPVNFTATATAVVILLDDSWWRGGLGFFGPDGSPDVTVPVGTPVEWANILEAARIVSTSAPPGGTSFDSGELGVNDRFEFVPRVAGTWAYVDQVSGSAGTLTAR
jgi:hypothetical protein